MLDHDYCDTSAAPNRKHAFETTAARPIALPVLPHNIPAELREAQRWVVWRYTWSPKKLKWDKPPTNANSRRPASSTDPRTWATFKTAHSRFTKQDFSGIGFVFSPDDGYTGIDLDDCRDPATGTIDAWAVAIITRLNTYTEVSPSSTGVKLVCRAVLPPKANGKTGRKITIDGHEIEVYDRDRYFTVTGHRIGTADINDAQAAIDALLAEAEGSSSGEPGEGTAIPAATRGAFARSRGCAAQPVANDLDLDDGELIRRALAAEHGSKFARLWAGDTSDYNGDKSRADLALCSLLAFWTGGDATRIEQLFGQSGLCRDKWGRDDYRALTISKALAGKSEFYNPARHSKDARRRAAAERSIEAALDAEARGDAPPAARPAVDLSDIAAAGPVPKTAAELAEDQAAQAKLEEIRALRLLAQRCCPNRIQIALQHKGNGSDMGMEKECGRASCSVCWELRKKCYAYSLWLHLYHAREHGVTHLWLGRAPRSGSLVKSLKSWMDRHAGLYIRLTLPGTDLDHVLSLIPLPASCLAVRQVPIDDAEKEFGEVIEHAPQALDDADADADSDAEPEIDPGTGTQRRGPKCWHASAEWFLDADGHRRHNEKARAHCLETYCRQKEVVTDPRTGEPAKHKRTGKPRYKRGKIERFTSGKENAKVDTFWIARCPRSMLSVVFMATCGRYLPVVIPGVDAAVITTTPPPDFCTEVRKLDRDKLVDAAREIINKAPLTEYDCVRARDSEFVPPGPRLSTLEILNSHGIEPKIINPASKYSRRTMYAFRAPAELRGHILEEIATGQLLARLVFRKPTENDPRTAKSQPATASGIVNLDAACGP